MFLNCNTDLCMDVKTLLRTDRVTKLGKNWRTTTLSLRASALPQGVTRTFTMGGSLR